MHGRVKVRTTEEQRIAKELERQKRCKAFLKLRNALFAKHEASDYDEAGLKLSEQLLLMNPDFATVFAYRKRALSAIHNLTQRDRMDLETVKPILASELEFATACLQKNPKSYGAWHHRRWVLSVHPEPLLEHELGLCTKFLSLDERNFHCWDYRRHVVALLDAPDAMATELAFTEDKITANFSNYSAWHNRSNLLLQQSQVKHAHELPQDVIDAELELLTNALYIDPQDQSAWFYHRWLLGREGSELVVLHVIVKQNKLYLVLNVACVPCQSVRVSVQDKPIEGSWSALQQRSSSPILVFTPTAQCSLSHAKVEVPAGAIVSSDQSGNKSPLSYPVGYANADNSVALRRWKPCAMHLVEGQLESLTELLEELQENESKWCRLRLVELLWDQDVEANSEAIKEHLSKLLQVDTMRRAYYQHLHAKLVVQLSYMADPCAIRSNLSNAQLAACPSNLHLLANRQQVDLSGNELTSSQGLEMLIACEELNLAGNPLQLSPERGLELGIGRLGLSA
eukprot:TRINITY_DN10083_c0_g1_i2.p1 TRINITY_DN10083_c0_g1~~TRINITY_DN10083_c0_g1_i2.p1  ORF type:complete len:512 (+),score=104.29 TRINITY_DN10083_c0_g1_i2:71-1606(+)